MERHAVAFAVDHDGAPAVRRNGCLGLDNLAAVGCYSSDRLVETAVSVQVKQRTFRGGLFSGVLYKTAAGIAFAMGQDAERAAGDLRLLDGSTDDGGIELYRPIEVF